MRFRPFKPWLLERHPIPTQTRSPARNLATGAWPWSVRTSKTDGIGIACVYRPMATRWLAGLEPAGRRLCPANAADEWSAALRIPISGMLFADWLYRSALSRLPRVGRRRRNWAPGKASPQSAAAASTSTHERGGIALRLRGRKLHSEF